MRVIAIIQARMNSSRLPGKVLMPVLSRPLLLHMVERVRRARHIDEVIVATSTQSSDDPVAKTMEAAGIACHRGPLDDVLERYCQAAACFGPADAIMRLSGDCPLIDWRILDDLVALLEDSGADYASNVHPPTFPDGLDAEIFTAKALDTACLQASTAYEREHVTPYFYTHPELFTSANLVCKTGDLSHHRWTVDRGEDFEKVKCIIEAIAEQKPDFAMEDILHWLGAHREVDILNQKFERNEGSMPEKGNAT